MDPILTLPQQQISSVLKEARDRKHSDALNIMISVGLLTKDSSEFYINKNRLSGERKDNVFRVWNNRTSTQVFHAEVNKDSVSVVIFVRGEWEKHLEETAKNGAKEATKTRRKPLKLKERTD